MGLGKTMSLPAQAGHGSIRPAPTAVPAAVPRRSPGLGTRPSCCFDYSVRVSRGRSIGYRVPRSRHALPSLMRRKPLDLNPSRTPQNTNLTHITQAQGGVKENLQVLLGFLGIFRLFHDDLPDACRGPHLHSRVDRDGRLPAVLIPGDATAGIPDARVLGSRGGSRRSADVPERVYEPSTSGRHGDGGRRSHANLRRGERPGCREPGLARAPSGLLGYLGRLSLAEVPAFDTS